MKRVFLLLFALFLSFPVVAQANRNTEESLYLGSKSPYPVPENIESTAPPKGYELSFLYTLNRHGSRNLSSFKYDKAWIDMLTAAEEEGALSEMGKNLKGEIQQISAYEDGKYGLLTSLGKHELFGIGLRAGQNYKALFSSNKPFLADSTYKDRAQDSRDNFLAGLKEAGYKGEIQSVVYEKGNDPYLRPFDLASRFNDYLDNGSWITELKSFEENDENQKMADRVCSQFFTPAFLERLNSGQMEFIDAKGKTVINSAAKAATALYELYIILPALKEDGFSELDLGKYFLPEELVTFEKIQNAESYYECGSGTAASHNISLNIMAPLTKKIIMAIDDSLEGSSPYLGVSSFAHAETLVPLVGFLEIERANINYDNVEEAVNNWSSSYYGPMGGNLQFVIYTSAEGAPLVKVLLQERESSLAEELKPVSGPYYLWSDVEDYYGNKVKELGVDFNGSLEEDLLNLKENF